MLAEYTMVRSSHRKERNEDDDPIETRKKAEPEVSKTKQTLRNDVEGKSAEHQKARNSVSPVSGCFWCQNERSLYYDRYSIVVCEPVDVVDGHRMLCIIGFSSLTALQRGQYQLSHLGKFKSNSRVTI